MLYAGWGHVGSNTILFLLDIKIRAGKNGFSKYEIGLLVELVDLEEVLFDAPCIDVV